MRHKINRSLSHILVVAIICSLVSCRSSKPAATDSPTDKSVTATRTDNPIDAVAALVDSYKDWSDVSMSVKCNLRSPKVLSVSGKASMIRGKEIKMSFRMLGFEVAGFYADCDTIAVYEKLNHTMIVEPMDRLTSATGIDINGVQDLLLGQIAESINAATDTQPVVDGDNISITAKHKSYDIIYTMLRNVVPTLLSIEVDAPAKGRAVCRYATPFVTEAGPASPKVDLTATFGKLSVDGSLSWSLETASWNKGLKPDNNLPKGYRRITADQLFKMLGK